MKIIVDGFGGDYAPQEIIEGAVNAINAVQGFDIVLTGKEEIISHELKNHSFDRKRLTIINAGDVITNEDIPTTAIKTKNDSSLVKALAYLKENEEAKGLVSAGSTGAVLTGGLLKIGRINGVSRPALAPILPTVKDGKVLLIDCGANVDCKSIHLCHFAVMGSIFAENYLKIKNPRVGLLSNGTEDKKGNELNKEAFPILKSMQDINFIGNIEGRDILSGEVDVVVSDGFNGNIALKTMEGSSTAVLKMIKSEVSKKLRYKIGAWLLKPMFNSLRNKMDYNQSGGAIFLGVDKIIIKSHGSSKASSITASILQVKDMHETKVIEIIKEKITNYELRITNEA